MLAGDNVHDKSKSAGDKTADTSDRRDQAAASKLLLHSNDLSSGKQRKEESAAQSNRLEQENRLGRLSLTNADSPKDSLRLSLPESVLSKAHPKKGEGYYQALEAAGKELLGKDLSGGEMKALVSAARALRQKQGKSLSELSRRDQLLPGNKEELNVFIDNIGNQKYGKQSLSKDGISKLKDSLSKKMQLDDHKGKTSPTEQKTQPIPGGDLYDFGGGGKRDKASAEATEQKQTQPQSKDSSNPQDASGNTTVSPEKKDNPDPADKSATKPVSPDAKETINQQDIIIKGKPFDRFNVGDGNAPFVDIQPEQAAKLLDTPPGKVLAPIAERFEQNALKQLGPEPQPNIYVSKEANDKSLPPGATSYRTINEAMKHAQQGSVIQVLPGVYNEKISLNGESQSNISIQTDRQSPAVINGGGFRIGSGAHDISIRNFEIKNFSGQDAGIRIDGSNIHDITIAGNNVHDASNSEGIAVYGRAGTPVSRISIIGNRVHDLKLKELEAIPINGNVDGFKVIGNSGYHLDNLFVDVIGGEGNGGNKDQARNGVIAYNFADGISTKHNPSYNGYSSAAIYSDGGQSLDIYGNYVRNSDFGVEIGSEHRGLNSSDVRVHNNIIENSTTWLKLGYKGGVDNTSVKDNLVINNRLSDVEREGPVAASVHVDGNIRAADRHHISKIPGAIMERTT